jgi:hypothetical protein
LPFPAARQPSTLETEIAASSLPTLRFSWGSLFRGFTTVHVRYSLSICSPSCRSRPGLHPADEDFRFRASDGLVTRSAAGYDYRGNWASSPGRIFTYWNANQLRCSPRSALRLKVPGVRFHELGWEEPLWRIGIAWNRNSDKLPLISRLVKVVQAVVGDQEV